MLHVRVHDGSHVGQPGVHLEETVPASQVYAGLLPADVGEVYLFLVAPEARLVEGSVREHQVRKVALYPGTGIQGRNTGNIQSEVGVKILVAAHPACKLYGRASEVKHTEANVEDKGNQFLAVSPDAEAQLVDGAFLAVEYEAERRLFPIKAIGYHVEGTCGVDHGHGIFDLFP